MPIRKLKTKCIEVSGKGRVKLLKNSWFTPTAGCVGLELIEPGKVYLFVIDDSLMTIQEVREPVESGLTVDYISNLQDQEISRLQALVEFQAEFIATHPDKYMVANYFHALEHYSGCDRHSLQSEIEHFQRSRHAARDTRYSVKDFEPVRGFRGTGNTTYKEDCRDERFKDNGNIGTRCL